MPKEYERIIKTNSIDGWTRDVIISDDFDNGLIPWVIDKSAASVVEIDNSIAFKGGASVKILTGAANGNYGAIQKQLPTIRTEKLEMVMAVRMGDPGAFTIMCLWTLQGADTTTQFRIGWKIIQLAIGNITIQIWDNAVWTDVATGLAYSLAADFVNLKLFVNLRTEKYERMEIGRMNIDLTSRVVQATAIPQTALDPVQWYMSLTTNEAVAHETHFDRLYVIYGTE